MSWAEQTPVIRVGLEAPLVRSARGPTVVLQGPEGIQGPPPDPPQRRDGGGGAQGRKTTLFIWCLFKLQELPFPRRIRSGDEGLDRQDLGRGAEGGAG